MGLFSKFRPEDKPRPLVALPYHGHARTYTSESSGVDAGEFSLTASTSSYSSQDTKGPSRNRHSMPTGSNYAKSRPSQLQQEHSVPPSQPTNRQRQSFPGPIKETRPDLGYHASAHLGPSQQDLYRQNPPPTLPYLHFQSPGRLPPQSAPLTPSKNGYPLSQDDAFYSPNHTAYSNGQYTPPNQLSPRCSPQHGNIASSPQQPAYYAPRPLVHSVSSGNIPALYTGLSSPPPVDSEASDEYTSESESESDSERHPYYQQWKQYYATMASYRTAMDPKVIQRHSMYPGVVPADSPYMQHYNNNLDKSRLDSGLVRNSRRSTIKLNRSSSLPLVALDKKSHTRAVSINVTMPADKSMDEQSGDETMVKEAINPIIEAPFEPVQPPRISAGRYVSGTSHRLVSSGLGAVTESDRISDYGAFLMETEDEHTTTIDDAEPDAVPAPEIAVSDLQKAINEVDSPNTDSPPTSGLNRQESSASTSSYNSLQSEKDFAVGRVPNRIATQTEALRRLSRKAKFAPPMSGPPPPIFSESSRSTVRSPSMDSIEIPYQMQIQQMHQMEQLQQQIIQLQQLQQMQAIPAGSPPPAPRSSDRTINAKIEEFVLLRKVIASGNKTFEFRLQWAKMLMTATNYKLYSYINIRGDSISNEQVAGNKLLFVKLLVTHLQKMLKELDKKILPNSSTFAEACYLYGCLLKHDYVERFGQDFGVVQNFTEAENYFHRCLELKPTFFKAHYKLGELYEQEQTEERFDMAFAHYKEAAKMGYNRAIYRVAVIMLMVPKVRLTRFYKYLANLAGVDMQSSDIQLSGDDRDELEEVVGLAAYQLGKIFEGIYPGDLSPDDEFVVASLELAPVNYARSLSYYNRSAKLHCLQAQVKLGHVYEQGDLNRKQNPSKSIQWFIKALTSPLKFKRHPEAMLGISRWFLVGTNGQSKHVPQPDPQRALMWCERACKEFSFPEAFYAMGQLAEQGLAQGDPQEWYAEAHRLGFTAA